MYNRTSGYSGHIKIWVPYWLTHSIFIFPKHSHLWKNSSQILRNNMICPKAAKSGGEKDKTMLDVKTQQATTKEGASSRTDMAEEGTGVVYRCGQACLHHCHWLKSSCSQTQLFLVPWTKYDRKFHLQIKMIHSGGNSPRRCSHQAGLCWGCMHPKRQNLSVFSAPCTRI